MAERQNYKLNDKLIRSICSEPPKKVVRHGDGDNLYLFHKPDGGIYWIFEYSFQTEKDLKPKRKNIQFGIYKSTNKQLTATFKPEMSIKDARIERDRLKALVKQGIDPLEQKKKQRSHATESDLFKNIVAGFLQHKEATTTPNYVKKTTRFFNNHILKYLGNYPIQAITAQDVIKMGQEIEKKFLEQGKSTSYTAHKSIGLVSEVFNYAIDVKGFNIPNIASGRTRALKAHHAKRMKRVEPQEFPELLKRIDSYCEKYQRADIQTSCALKLIALCFVRTQELRLFEWNEIDTLRQVWRIPATKMKMRRDHVIPLSPQAMKLISDMRPITGNTDYVFFNFRTNKPFSEAWLNQALAKMGYKGQMTGHGFRGLASTSLNEMHFNKDIIELQLAHLDETSTSSRYDTSNKLQQRQDMMYQWANYLDDLRAGRVVNFDLEPIEQNNDDVKDEFELFKKLKSAGLLEDLIKKLDSYNVS